MNKYFYHYQTPADLDDLFLYSDGEALTGVCFRDQKEGEERMLPIFSDAIRWLDHYFQEGRTDELPKHRLEGLTPFRQEVLDELLQIPYGGLTTYGEIAKRIGKKHGSRMSAQAVGQAVGWNPLCILIPCHRVIGKDGKMTGYGGGLANKIAVLRREGHEL